jgi:hypothetical protein
MQPAYFPDPGKNASRFLAVLWVGRQAFTEGRKGYKGKAGRSEQKEAKERVHPAVMGRGEFGRAGLLIPKGWKASVLLFVAALEACDPCQFTRRSFRSHRRAQSCNV